LTGTVRPAFIVFAMRLLGFDVSNGGRNFTVYTWFTVITVPVLVALPVSFDGDRPPIRGKLDQDGRLIEADPELEALQRDAGGALGQLLAVPQLAAIARPARDLGTPVSPPAIAPFRFATSASILAFELSGKCLAT